MCGRAGEETVLSLIFVKASGSGYLRPRNQRSFGSVYVNPLKKEPPGLIQERMCLAKGGTGSFTSSFRNHL